MAPKIERPVAVQHLDAHAVAGLRNGVRGLPVRERLDRAHLGEAGRADGRARPAVASFETVPEPMIVPAASGRVFAAWAIRLREIEGHVDAGVGLARTARR